MVEEREERNKEVIDDFTIAHLDKINYIKRETYNDKI